MINVISTAGQRGNRLYTDAHCLAAAIEFNQDITFWTSESFIKEYNCKVNKIKADIKQKRSIKIKLLILWYRILEKLGYSQNVEKLIEKAKKGKDIYVFNWLFRMENEFRKYQEQISSFFEPTDEAKSWVPEKVNELRKDYDCLIAVHIRRGDFKNWHGGKYFYSFERYYEWIKQAQDVLKEKGKCIFVIFSNEELPSFYNNGEIPMFISNGSAIEDQYFISECDYIISTRSTFASWAEYIGGGLRAAMVDEKDDIILSSFINNFDLNLENVVL